MLSPQKMKNLINQKSKEAQLPPQQLYGLYALEQFLIRLYHSPYRNNVILKGGYLLSVVFGLENRVTRDLDTTIREKKLTYELVENIAKYVCEDKENTNAGFKFIGIKETREEFEYRGYELKLMFKNGSSRIPISIDITTGEELIAIEEAKDIPLLFEKNKELRFSRYSIEQILTDKFYTMLAYGKYDDTNSRMKDYYDIYLLTNLEKEVDYSLIKKGLEKIMNQRNEFVSKGEYQDIIFELSQSNLQKSMWENYREATPFAKELEFKEVIESISRLARHLV